MGLFEGKKGLVLGIANNFSIAWAITRLLAPSGDREAALNARRTLNACVTQVSRVWP